MDKIETIYDFVIEQENAMSSGVQIAENFSWSFKDHVSQTVHAKNSKFLKGANDYKRPYKNIILPILRLQYRTEGFDVKDIEMFVDDSQNYYKSFLVRKYHTMWAREHGLDDFIDSLVETYVDFGGVLVKKTTGTTPEVVAWQSVAFCDQTDILSGPIAIDHFYSPSQLKEMVEKGWGSENYGATVTVDELIALAEQSKENEQSKGVPNKTPGKYIKIYEVHGEFPEYWLGEAESDNYTRQLHIIGFYTDSQGKKEGVTLFKGKEATSPFKLLLRDGIFGRALGLGGVEELFQSQIWVNYGKIRITEMLDAASKIVYITDDSNFVNRNPNLSEVENNQVLDLATGTTIRQLDTTPRNANQFDNNNVDWENSGQSIGSAFDPLMGAPAPSGSTFRGQERQVIEGKGIHDYRRGKIATFLDEMYQDWFMVQFAKDIVKKQSFLVELSADEMQEIITQVAENEANRTRNEQVLSAELPEDKEALKTNITESFFRSGNKKFLEILEKELKDIPVSVRLNIAQKQAYLGQLADKITGVFQQLLNPQTLQVMAANPGLAKPFNELLESQGLSPIQFAGLMKLETLQPASAQPQPITQ